MTTPEQDPSSVFGQQPSFMSRVKDSVAVQPPAGPGTFGAIRTGYRAGKQLASEDNAASQSAPTHWGYVGNDAHGTTSNVPELATSEDIAGLHSRFDQLQGSIGGMQGSGQSNANLQQLGSQSGLRLPPRAAGEMPGVDGLTI